MAKRWNELTPRTRRIVVVGAAVDSLLKAVALADLVRQPSSEVRGSKVVWGIAIAVVNSVGLLPILYFALGRRGSPPASS